MTAIDNLHDFFAALPPSVQMEFDAVSSFRHLAKGEAILRAGDRPAAVYQISDGYVKYSSCDRQGRETVITFMTAGDWIGLSEPFSDLPTPWNVTAFSPVRLRVIKRADFQALVDRHPVVALQLLRMFSRRFTLFFFGHDHSTLSLKERTLKMLFLLSYSYGKEAGEDEAIAIKIPQEELSRIVGASRQKLNQALKELEREELLDIGYGVIRLCGRNTIRTHYGHLFEANHAAIG